MPCCVQVVSVCGRRPFRLHAARWSRAPPIPSTHPRLPGRPRSGFSSRRPRRAPSLLPGPPPSLTCPVTLLCCQARFGPELDFVEVFYYPHDAPVSAGPTELVPRTHLSRYEGDRDSHPDGVVCADPAGSFVVHHQSILHRRSAVPPEAPPHCSVTPLLCVGGFLFASHVDLGDSARLGRRSSCSPCSSRWISR